jgi:hypothetical protein
MISIQPNIIEKWLNTKLFENNFTYLDYWSGIHFLAGYTIGKIPIIRSMPILVLLLLIGYEIFEFIFWGSLFRPESIKNIFTDIWIGMLGYITAQIIPIPY